MLGAPARGRRKEEIERREKRKRRKEKCGIFSKLKFFYEEK
jgi:hypothetical protein